MCPIEFDHCHDRSGCCSCRGNTRAGRVYWCGRGCHSLCYHRRTPPSDLARTRCHHHSRTGTGTFLADRRKHRVIESFRHAAAWFAMDPEGTTFLFVRHIEPRFTVDISQEATAQLLQEVDGLGSDGQAALSVRLRTVSITPVTPCSAGSRNKLKFRYRRTDAPRTAWGVSRHHALCGRSARH